MQIMGFMDHEAESVLEVVAAVLKLGNIEFKPESRVNGLDESKIKDKNGKSVEDGPCWEKLTLNFCPVFNVESKTYFELKKLSSETEQKCNYSSVWSLLIYIFYTDWFENDLERTL